MRDRSAERRHGTHFPPSPPSPNRACEPDAGACEEDRRWSWKPYTGLICPGKPRKTARSEEIPNRPISPACRLRNRPWPGSRRRDDMLCRSTDRCCRRSAAVVTPPWRGGPMLPPSTREDCTTEPGIKYLDVAACSRNVADAK